MTPVGLAVDPIVWWTNALRVIAAAALLLGYLGWRLWVWGRTRSSHWGEFTRKRLVDRLKRR